MSYQVFARKYRPKTFQDVLGQDHVVQTLKNAIDQDRLAHAYLFVGPRGTGKTSTARILAKALNCPGGPSIEFDPEHEICQEIAEGTSLDVLEIDGASNNGVEQVRDLRDNVRFAPTSGKFKIYYIDEVHMLSTAAFNALLKTLEEPPEHVKFIFATTEPNKILPTIISRCQRFDLRPISAEVIAKHLQFIASEEGVELSDAGAWAIAKGADGGMRDAQSMLDQLVAFCGSKITEENVLSVFGFTSREIIANLSTAILKKDTTAALQILHNEATLGKDLGQLLDELISCIRIILVSKVDPAASNEGIPAEHWETLCHASADTTSDRLLNIIDLFAEAESRMKWASNKRLHLEIGIIKAIQSLHEVRISDVITALAGAGPLAVEDLPKPEPTITEPKADKAVSPEPETAVAAAPSEQTEPADPTPQETPPQAATTAQPEQQSPADKVTETAQPAAPPASSTTAPAPSATAPTPTAADSVQPSSPSAGTVTDDFFASPAAEPSNQETPSTQSSQATAVAEPPAQPKTAGPVDFDALIAAAPDISPEPEPAPLPAQPSTPAPEPEETVKEEDQQPKLDETFYEDPLIIEALEMFKGRLVKS